MLRNLKALMAWQSITGTEISKLLGIDVKTVSKKIHQHTEFTRDEMFKIYNTYFKGEDMAELFKGDKN